MKRGYKNKAVLIMRTLNAIERIEHYLELAKSLPFGDYNIIKDDVLTYKAYLNPKRRTRTYRTVDLIFINRLINAERLHLKEYLNSQYGLKKEV